jgi:hypothetical protein
VAGTVQRLRLAWSHLGAIDRKDKKRLDQLFAAALTTLQGPLEEQRKMEVRARGTDREVAGARSARPPRARPPARHAGALAGTCARVAARTQGRAGAVAALPRRLRQVFASARKARTRPMPSAAPTKTAKEAISARLEAAAPEATPASAGKLLREAAAEWHAIGPVPRAHEARVEKRYHAAVAKVQHHADCARRAAGLALAGALRDKLRLPGAGDSLASLDQRPRRADWRARWAALLAAGPDYDPVLRRPLRGGPERPGGRPRRPTRACSKPTAALLGELLRQEIAAGIDSGAEFARDRLKLQVEALQSSLKSGHKPAGQAGARAGSLRAVRAAGPGRRPHRARIEQLFMRLAREGK